MTSVSLEEKRLKLLKQQLFGKEQPTVSHPTTTKSQNAGQVQITTAVIDQVSIKQDLFKVVSFSLVALAIQLSLFFASRQGLITLFR